MPEDPKPDELGPAIRRAQKKVDGLKSEIDKLATKVGKQKGKRKGKKKKKGK